MILGQGYRR